MPDPEQQELKHKQRRLVPSTHVRWMIRRDLPEVLVIEAATTSPQDCWCEEDILAVLRQCHCIGIVAEEDEVIIGYAIYELHKQKLVLPKLAVAPRKQRQGVGRKMVSYLLAKLSYHHRTYLEMTIPESNLPGLFFLRSCGFLAADLLHNHYEKEDGILMRFTCAIVSSKNRV